MIDAIFAKELRHRVTIKRRTRVSDGYGGERWVYNQTIATDVHCLIQGLPIRQAELGKYRMWVPYSTDVQETDQITWTGEGNNEVLYVGFVDNAGGQAHHKECDLQEISGSG